MTHTVNDDPRTWPCHHLASDEDALPDAMMCCAYANAFMWLHQAAAGMTPYGGYTQREIEYGYNHVQVTPVQVIRDVSETSQLRE